MAEYTEDDLALLLHHVADADGQWNGADLCDALALLAKPALRHCGHCWCVYPTVLKTCPYCKDER